MMEEQTETRKIEIVGFTHQGMRTACRISCALEQAETGASVRVWCKKEELWDIPAFSQCEIHRVPKSIREWTGEHFSSCDAMIFVGATGIAVRSIAPFLVSKKTDPAVLAVDEMGHYVISLVSGHIGGANELCQKIAGKIEVRLLLRLPRI